MSGSPTICPKCGLDEIAFISKTGQWLCTNTECNHRWASDATVSLATPGATCETVLLEPVFISYGRADAIDFAQRLADDLKQLGHQGVFLDLRSIEKGAAFEVRIEQGIRESTVLAAVMSRRSQADDSVCRDEVVFALNEGKKVVPLRIDPDPALKPTLLLARRNWIDFSENYQEGLEALLALLKGDDSHLQEPSLPNVTGVVPLDFSVEIARFYAGFTGREWIGSEINHWLTEQEKRAFVIVAEPGVGKSAIAAWLSQTRHDVVGIHFCTQQNTRSCDPFEFVGSLVGQLQARLPGFSEAVALKEPEVRRATASDAFRELIVETYNSFGGQPEHRLIIVDSLDEAASQKGENVIDVLVGQARDLPSWLRIVTTTRPEEPILRRIRNLRVFDLQTERNENRGDVRNFIDVRLSTKKLGSKVGADVSQVASQIDTLASGNFLYARLVLDELDDGSLNAADLGQLAAGLEQFYADAFNRRFPDIEVFSQQYTSLLRVLAVACAPLPFRLLQRLCNQPAESVHQRLLNLRSYLKVFGSGESAEYALFHKSLQDWLTNRDASGPYWCQASSGHKLLAETCRSEYDNGVESMPRYGLAYMPAHLIAVERWDDLELVLTDIEYLEAKFEDGLILGLADDFSRAVESLPPGRSQRRILQLLDEALRRDIHFIARHAEDYPQALFQCLWNSCWWHDCDAAGIYYKPPPEGWPAAGPPWERTSSGDRISELMESWLSTKNGQEGKLRWCRSMRPPLHPLGAGQKVVLRGHSDRVNDLAFSPDDRKLVTASNDGSVCIWDLANGSELIRIRDSASWVHAVSVSSDGERIASASGSTDGIVRVFRVSDGKLLWSSPVSRGRATSVAFQPGSHILVSGGYDAVLHADDRDTRIWGVPVDGPVSDLSYSGDGRYLVVTTTTGTATLLCSATGNQEWQVECLDRIRSASVSHRGDTIAVASESGRVTVYERNTKMELKSWTAHSKKINRIRYSNNDNYLACASDDHTATAWHAEDARCLVRLHGHENHVLSLRFSSEGNLLATASRDRTARVWSLNECITSPINIGHHEWIRSVQVAPDNDVCATSSDDGSIWIWDAEDGSPLECLRGHTGIIRCIAFSPDGWYLVSGSDDNSIRTWNLETYSEEHCLTGHDAEIRSVAFHPDGDQIVSCSFDDTIRIWEIERGTELYCFRGQDEGLRNVAFVGDGSILHCLLYDGTEYYLDTNTEQIIESPHLSADEKDDTPWRVRKTPRGMSLMNSRFPHEEFWVPDLALATVIQMNNTLVGASGKGFYLYSLSGAHE